MSISKNDRESLDRAIEDIKEVAEEVKSQRPGFMSSFAAAWGSMAAYFLAFLLVMGAVYTGYYYYVKKPIIDAKNAVVQAPGKAWDATKEFGAELKPDCWHVVGCDPDSEEESETTSKKETKTKEDSSWWSFSSNEEEKLPPSEEEEVLQEALEEDPGWKFWE